MTLSAGANAITAATLGVANAANMDNNAGPVTSTINLGTTNTLNVNTISISPLARLGGVVQFAAGLSNPTLTIAGAAGGASTAALTVGTGKDSNENGENPNDLLDTSAGTLTGQFSSITIGQCAALEQFTPTASALTRRRSKWGPAHALGDEAWASSVINNRPSSNTGLYTFNDTALFSVSNGGTATIPTLTVASNSYNGGLTGANTLNAQITIGSSTTTGALDATTIQKGTIAATSSGTLNVTSQINFNNGTIGNISGGLD